MNATTETVGPSFEERKRFGLPAWFISSAAAILAVTGQAKVWSAFSHTKMLVVADPITGISFGHLLLAVEVLELVIASICLFAKSQTLKLGLIAWLATNFVVYRLGLWWIGWLYVSVEGYNRDGSVNAGALNVYDLPAVYHNKASAFSFADGHAAMRRWQGGIILNDTDLVWLMTHATVPQ